MVTLQALKAKIDKLTKQAEGIAKRQRSGAVQRVTKLMQRLGVTAADLAGGKGQQRGGGGTKKAAGVAKYRDPATGKSWTGHGRAPDWIKGASNRDDFLVTLKAGPKRTNGAARKAAGGVAKYRDPSTGTTWTGHGRAPQWIRGAKNRDDFLIGATASAGASAAPAKKAARKTAKAANGAPAKRARKRPAKAAKAAKSRKTTAAKNGAAQAGT